MAKLIEDSTGNEIHIGDIVKTLRGEKGILVNIIPSRNVNSTGRVQIRITADHIANFFPAMIGARIIED